MRSRLSNGILLSLFLSACGAGQTPEAQLPQSSSPATVAASGTESTEPAIAELPEPAAPADAPLELRLRAELGEGSVVTLVVEVRGGAAHLSSAIQIEREVDGHFEPVTDIASLELRADCQAPAPECVEVVAGAELRPPSWFGTLGDAQCICTRCAVAPAGNYRFVLTSCDGRQRVESSTFALSAR